MATDQRCGTCRWGRKDGKQWVACTFPLPACSLGSEPMYADEGTTCPCYQPAQQPQPQTETEDDGN